MPYIDKPIIKKYYSIGEVAGMFGVATSLLRFWEKEFDSINPKKSKNGKRQYVQADIDNVKVIFHLVKEKGHTLAGAKDLLKNQGDRSKQKIEIIESLSSLKVFLTELRSNLSDD